MHTPIIINVIEIALYIDIGSFKKTTPHKITNITVNPI